MPRLYPTVLLACVLLGCGEPRFELLGPEESGIGFVNAVTDSDSVNILTYEYLYNGGGVGVGDFDGDGRPDLFFTGNQVPGRLYLNLGKLRFTDRTEASGIDTRGHWVYGVSVVDINQDGLSDLYLSVGGMGNRDAFPNLLYVNQGPDADGTPTFAERAAAYGLDDAGESIQAAFLDYDRDGDLDLYLLTGGGFERSAIDVRPLERGGTARNTDRLYRNDFDATLGHPVFTDVSGQAGITHEGFGLGVAVTDVNEDGWPDMYVTNDYLSPDHLYVNGHDGTFREESARYFDHGSHFAMGNDAGDINNDGHPDLISVDMLPADHRRRMLMYGPDDRNRFRAAEQLGYGRQYMRNTLQVHDGVSGFQEVGQFAGVQQTDWSWSPLLADLDNDGRQDLYVTNGFGKDITDRDFVKFRRETARSGDRETQRLTLTEALRERPAIRVPNAAFRNLGGLSFGEAGAEWGFGAPSLSNGAAYADLDGDGDLDLVVNNLNEPAFLYRNTTTEGAERGCHYLRVELRGPAGNLDALGTRVELRYGNGQQQVRYQNPVRGYLSTSETTLHFGLGEATAVDRLTITWPDGSVRVITGPEIDRTLVLNPEDGVAYQNLVPSPTALLETPDVLPTTGWTREVDFNDFAYQPLLLRSHSRPGPVSTAGDVNGDGREDFFVGGAYHRPGTLLLQEADGSFVRGEFPPADSASEDAGCLLFDADGDDDLDLYVVSGSSEYPAGHPQLADRLYRNDGRGHFTRDLAALPDLRNSGSCVVAADYDGDGDADLFVGGRVVPQAYPESPASTLLRNDGGRFTDMTDQLAPSLRRVGMVTAAAWTDTDGDGRPDLVVAGEAMPVVIFRNSPGGFTDVTDASGLADSDGLWNTLTAADFDGDGDPDLVAGNQGLNAPYRVSAREPLTIRYADFGGSGTTLPLIGAYEAGTCYPLAALDDLNRQLPGLKKHVLHHADYAALSLDELTTLTGVRDYRTLYVRTLASAYFENRGDGGFVRHDLPTAAQLGPIGALLAEDLNGDCLPDLLVAGNEHGGDVVTGTYDALRGLLLLGDGAGGFRPVPAAQSGFYLRGEVRSLSAAATDGGARSILATRNDADPVLFRTPSFITPPTANR